MPGKIHEIVAYKSKILKSLAFRQSEQGGGGTMQPFILVLTVRVKYVVYSSVHMRNTALLKKLHP